MYLMKLNIGLSNLDITEKTAFKIGENLKGGECIEFISDLGGGKTTFTKSLVRGAGSTDMVSSPTFTVMKQYSAPEFVIYHFDFYRLSEPGLVAEELAEATKDNNAVIVVEWAETVRKVLPESRITITLSKVASDPEARICNIEYPEELDYALKELEKINAAS